MPGKIVISITTFVVASAAAALICGFDLKAWLFADATPTTKDVLTFNDRFVPGSSAPAADPSARLLLQSWSSELELKLQQAKARLAEKLQSQKVALADPLVPSAGQVADELRPSIGGKIPLPRARPIDARFEAQNVATTASAYARPEDRTLLQKLSDLLPSGGITLASLGPDTGVYHDGPDLSALGYDRLTAVYDISAHAVYMPNGTRLEAHSGMGNLMDDPEHVNERMVGATPPTVYDLKPREKLFHGVAALRMIPQDSNATLGRSGLLTHSYMLGPRGDSNGCVSIKNYDAFLKSFRDGDINRMVVVPSLNQAVTVSQRSDSQS